MKLWIKIGLAVVLAISAAVFGVLFYRSYEQVIRTRTAGTTNLEEVSIPGDAAPAEPGVEKAPALADDADPVKAAGGSPEEVAAQPAARPAAKAAIKPAAKPPAASASDAPSQAGAELQAQRSSPVAGPKAPAPAARRTSHLAAHGAAFLGSVILLGLLVGREVSHYLAHRTVQVLYDEDGAGLANQEYEQAEQEWANGNHMEAIRLMREYLNRNPREQHVALRIAEIYEKELKNHLAAALEYEEILGHKLSPERWGWAAIHLCNLYYRLNQPDKAVSLLRRIDSEYGQTKAAEKARRRLAMHDGTAPETAAGPADTADEPDGNPPSA
jgi:TolA-binding protein